jgi:hypothetical protein
MDQALEPDAGRPVVRFLNVLAAAFIGAWLSGIVAIIAFSSSACFVSRVNRCFSIQQDLPHILFGIGPALAAPSFIIAILVAAITHIRGVVVWWMVLITSLSVEFATAVLVGGALDEYPVHLAAGLVLFLGVQSSRLICRQY